MSEIADQLEVEIEAVFGAPSEFPTVLLQLERSLRQEAEERARGRQVLQVPGGAGG